MKTKRNVRLENKTRPIIADDYYRWLTELIEANMPDKSYWLLARVLHNKPYNWFVPNDDNRESDGLELRRDYLYMMGYDNETIEGPCSMLEMLIALAGRINSQMADLRNRDNTARWFWEILANVGLDRFTDDEYYDNFDGAEVEYILDTIIERVYRRDGRGGLFPLKHPKKDQRKVEIWYQMCSYLMENYYFEEEDAEII